MTREQLAAQAAQECSSAATTAHHGGAVGRPFWNACASQFMYTPAFDFAGIPGCKRYRFTAAFDGGRLSFEAESPRALLTPIWGRLPQGVITLTVAALRPDGSELHTVGARTFYKCAPFTGCYPPRARSYRQSAELAYRYAFAQPFIRSWLIDGRPDPDYVFNVYPSKTDAAIVQAMLRFAALCPECREEAMTVARRAADYLLSLHFPEDSPLCGLPPTYYLNFRPHPERCNNETAAERIGQMMMLYPIAAARSYLALEAATGEPRYWQAALGIADYYRKTVLPCGSWYLVRSVDTGEPIAENICQPYEMLEFFSALYDRTGETCWKELADGCERYLTVHCLETYHWEGQFEDSVLSANYSNLTHYGATAMARHMIAHYPDDPDKLAAAEDLLRFAEDQFVVWDKPAPWNGSGFDTKEFFTPAVYEQYNWYLPVDASMADLLLTFLSLYRLRRDPLLLAKARALGDMLTRMQNPDTGMIPTQWHRATCRRDGGGFWANCMFASANALLELAAFDDEEA